MMEINNLTNFAVDKKIFSTVAKNVLKGENRGTETLSLAFVDKEEIKKLNKKFRKKNKPTDVLSFNLKNPLLHKAADGQRKNILGEIIICPEVVEENAQKYKVPEKSEMLKVFVHGILHLCGYDHDMSEKEAEIMETKEKLYLQSII
jgi:probable rRNA maturation factor